MLEVKNTALTNENKDLQTDINKLKKEKTDLEKEKTDLKNENSTLKKEVCDLKINELADLNKKIEFIFEILNEKILNKGNPIKEIKLRKAEVQFIYISIQFFIKKFVFNSKLIKKFADITDTDKKITTLKFKDPELNKIFNINKSLEQIKVQIENFEKLSNLKKQNENFKLSDPLNEGGLDTLFG